MALFMTTSLSAGVKMTQGKYDPNTATVGQDIGNSLAQETARFGSRIADKVLSIKPTITVAIGERLNVFVEQDLHLEPYSG
jgi:type IV secretory pathway VirB10-like protein